MSKWKGNSHSIFKKKHPRFPQLGLCSLQSQCPPRPPVVDLSSTFLNHLPATQYTPRGHLLCLPSAQTRASYTLTHLPTTMSAGPWASGTDHVKACGRAPASKGLTGPGRCVFNPAQRSPLQARTEGGGSQLQSGYKMASPKH